MKDQIHVLGLTNSIMLTWVTTLMNHYTRVLVQSGTFGSRTWAKARRDEHPISCKTPEAGNKKIAAKPLSLLQILNTGATCHVNKGRSQPRDPTDLK